MFFDRRQVVREPIVLPIVLANGVTAVTRDVGPHGLYLRMPPNQRIDEWVRLELVLGRSGLRLSAVAQVLRTEPGVLSTGVALRLHSLQLRAID
jgi:hypothetical protein